MGKPEGRRPLGRPKHRWDDNIKMDLQKLGCGGGVWTGSRGECHLWPCRNKRAPWICLHFSEVLLYASIFFFLTLMDDQLLISCSMYCCVFLYFTSLHVCESPYRSKLRSPKNSSFFPQRYIHVYCMDLSTNCVYLSIQYEMIPT